MQKQPNKRDKEATDRIKQLHAEASPLSAYRSQKQETKTHREETPLGDEVQAMMRAAPIGQCEKHLVSSDFSKVMNPLQKWTCFATADRQHSFKSLVFQHFPWQPLHSLLLGRSGFRNPFPTTHTDIRGCSARHPARGRQRDYPVASQSSVPRWSHCALWGDLPPSEGNSGQKKTSAFCPQKNPAFCPHTLVLSGFKPSHLVLVTGPKLCSALQVNHLFSLGAGSPSARQARSIRQRLLTYWLAFIVMERQRSYYYYSYRTIVHLAAEHDQIPNDLIFIMPGSLTQHRSTDVQ